jgi:hypothetical protein
MIPQPCLRTLRCAFESKLRTLRARAGPGLRVVAVGRDLEVRLSKVCKKAVPPMYSNPLRRVKLVTRTLFGG